jgi:hypothetical protein
VPGSNFGWNGVPRFYLFFLVGCRGGTVVLGLADRVRRRPLLGAGIVLGWSAAAVAVAARHLDGVFGVGLLLRLFGLAAGIALAVLLAGWRPLRALGGLTLPVYVAHGPLVVALTWALYVTGAWPMAGVAPLLLPPVMALAVVAAALALHRALEHTAAAVLYAPPPQLWSRLAALSARSGRVGLPAVRLPRALRVPGGLRVTGQGVVHTGPGVVDGRNVGRRVVRGE